MALVPATIQVNFNANYVGLHRVCYKLSTDITYTCVASVTCSSIGPCSATISIMVDNETCDSVTYDVYVQPECILDPASLDARTEAQVVFVPDPSCKRYRYLCESAGLASIAVNPLNNGYLDGESGTLVPVVGDGVGATATVTIAGGVITGIAVTTPGNGYTAPPVIDLSGLTFVGEPPGISANPVATLLPCGDISQTDCEAGAHIVPTGTINVGDDVYMCNTGIPATPPEGFGTPELDGNCLCNCTEYTIEAPASDSVDYWYIACDGAVVSGTVVGGGADVGPVCMVTDSLVTRANGAAVVSVVTGAACDGV